MAIPKLALIPSGVADDKVFSVLPSNGDGDFDFDRGSTATRVNSQGLIETVSGNTPRLNYPLLDGKVVGCPSLLLEAQSTNLITYSEAFDNSYWGKVNTSFTDNQTTSPNGLLAGKLTRNVTTFSCIRDVAASTTLGSTYVFSAFYKKDTESTINHSILNENTGYVTFNFDTETISISRNDSGNAIETDGFGFEKYENGWYRVYLKFVRKGGSLQLQVARQDGGVIGQSTFIFGAQLEQGNLSSYIPTTTSATSRLAETCNGAGTSDTFSDNSGVLMAEISAFSNTDTSNRFISILNGTDANNGFFMFYGGATNRIRFQYNTSSDNFNFLSTDYNTEDNNKIAFKYKSNDISVWINGFELVNDTTILSTPTGLNNLAFDRSGSEDFYGNTKQVQYFDTALTDSELETLTSWISFQEMAEGQLYTIE